jgi:HEPN domain-containing protein
VNPETRNWLASAEYDLETARQLLRAGRYLYVPVSCQQAVEKTLKALITESTGAHPPRIHDLKRLASLASAELESGMAEFIAELTLASGGARYPDDLQQALMQYPEPVARSYLERTEEVIACLRADPRLLP